MAGVGVSEAKDLICELCRLFYDQGWVSGTGGGISVKAGDDRIVMAPSGVQKERMQPSDMYVLDSKGDVVEEPKARPPPYPAPKLSECSPLFMAAYELRGAGAVMHSHSLNAVMATMLDPQATEFTVTHLEMIKGIAGHGFYGNCVVPIIENTARECELTDRLRQAIADYPQANAVLVRRHGVYVWGKTWIQAKTQAECYDYLFAAAVKMAQLGLDASRPPAPLLAAAANGARANGGSAAEAGGKRAAEAAAGGNAKRVRGGRRPPAAVVLDIEGTVAPISFVADTMFSYARQHVRGYLEGGFEGEEVQADVEAIRQQAAEDGGAPIPAASAGQAAVVDAVVSWVEAAISADRKVGALKQLQGHVWRAGFKSGALVAQLFRDVPDALAEWRNAGIKVYIYSSGSREAQRQFFGHTQVGDLRPYLSGFFDTTSGPKSEARSYREIAAALGVDPSEEEVVFATDVAAEAVAAAEAGWRPVLVVREGNKPLPDGHGFRVITSVQQLLE
ncbi:enolase-phosphatase E1 [Monoraphidium neglectum]|uniref:Probable bifunctional methylthioribulose-1-phosphate dehydratase/enolase-phosphatase E1 n=1 Tax=Monoraphidium neglectum TaxID=145388 RepID=A0A0D2M9T3_9CHLO|nr:enolase-phosphatase E1 [Monoraphidium neglectum]KIZ00060.1 enolase-phosphatase E1 [Monoraphidium neglectum]|eukprot:XP_013899079.1 enolase-phosphatase E1 [Monoraphidium neglectum]